MDAARAARPSASALGARLGDEPLEAQGVQLVVAIPLVAVLVRDDLVLAAARGEHLAQLRDVDLERSSRRWRRILAPEPLDQPVRRHRLAGVEGQHGEQGARLSAAQGDPAPTDVGLDGSQDMNVHLNVAPGDRNGR